MEKYILILTGFIGLFITNDLKAQITIDKPKITNNSVLLEFGSENKGIIIPQVESTPIAVGGTFIFDKTDNTLKVWEEKNSSTNKWTNLTSNNIPGIPHTFTNSGEDVQSGQGVIIGAETTNKPGVLVLESSTKAMVLPLVTNPHIEIKSAIAGTIVYDTVSSTLAVYDGANWSYWK